MFHGLSSTQSELFTKRCMLNRAFTLQINQDGNPVQNRLLDFFFLLNQAFGQSDFEIV